MATEKIGERMQTTALFLSLFFRFASQLTECLEQGNKDYLKVGNHATHFWPLFSFILPKQIQTQNSAISAILMEKSTTGVTKKNENYN